MPEQDRPQDFDPAMQTDGRTKDEVAAAIRRTNYGDEGPHTFAPEFPTIAPALMIDWSVVEAFLKACRSAGVGYALGAKVPNDNSVPGRDFTAVDCSGFVRAAIRRATNPIVPIPDGSVVQQDWVQAKGFMRGTVADGSLKDGKIRIAFLNPQDSPEGVGHVVLILNSATVESHGGVGPDSRPFTGVGWQAKAKVYLLS